MQKLEKLTEQQTKLMDEVRDEWINLALGGGKDLKLEDVQDDIEWIYKQIKLPKPLIIIADSYLGHKLMYNILKSWSQVGSQVWSQVESQVWSQVESQVRSQVGSQVRSQVRSQVESQVRSQVGSQVESQVWSQVRSQVRSQVESQVESQVGSQVWSQVESQKLEFLEHGYGLGWSSWLSFYDYFYKIGLLSNKEFLRYMNFFKRGIWCTLWLEKVCILCKLPSKVLRDDRGRLHSISKPAVQWRDYLDNYFISGVGFDKELWEKVIKRELSIKEILELKNIEQRHIAISLHGADKLLAESQAKLVDKSKRGYQLYKVEGIEPHLLKYNCSSTGRVYVSFTPRTIMDANQAMAWKFNKTPEEWEQLKVEA